jgi:short-subunit dehydrogenase
MPLKGKTIYITGGTGGIGTPLVKRLRNAGAIVTAHDFSRDGDLVQTIDNICQNLRDNTPDILINMAGYNVFDYCENQNLPAIIDLNMMVPMLLSQAVLPVMKGRGSGHIVNIGSMTALIPLPHLTGYVAAKAGLKGFSDSLRRELGGTGIAITYIAPRAVKTDINTGIKAEVNDRTKVSYDDPNKVAMRIFHAIEGQQKEVRIGWPERIFALVNALLPRVIDNGLQKNRKIGEEILDKNKHKEKKHEEKTVPSIRIAH